MNSIIFDKFLQNSYNFHFTIANKYNYNRRKETCIYYVCIQCVSMEDRERDMNNIIFDKFYRIRTIFTLQSRIFPSVFQRLLGHVCAEGFSLKSKKAFSFLN